MLAPELGLALLLELHRRAEAVKATTAGVVAELWLAEAELLASVPARRRKLQISVSQLPVSLQVRHVQPLLGRQEHELALGQHERARQVQPPSHL